MKWCLTILMLMAASVCGAETKVWDFSRGLPTDGSLRKGSVLLPGEGLTAQDVNGKDVQAGFQLKKKFKLPDAFRFECEYTATPTEALSYTGHVWDDMYVTYEHASGNEYNKMGLQVQMSRYERSVYPVVYLGLGDRSCRIAGPSRPVKTGDRLSFAFTYDANRHLTMEFDGKTVDYVVPVAKPIVPSTLVDITVIGDRDYSYQGPLEGILHRVSITPLVRAPCYVVTEGRTSYERAEDSGRVALTVGNSGGVTLKDLSVRVRQMDDDGRVIATSELLVGDLTTAAARTLAVPVETRMRPGAGRLESVITGLRGTETFVCTNFCSLSVGRRFAERMPVVMWGYSGANSNVVNLGFTHATASFGFNSPVTDGTNLSAPLLTLDDALISGLRLAKSGRINYPSDSGDGRYYRHERDGSYNAASPVAEISQPAMRNYARRLAADESRVFGDHPAFGGVLTISEMRDTAFPSFNTSAMEYKAETGQWPPEEVSGKTPKEAVAKKRYPSGIVPEDDPYYAYYRWYWKKGDGWPAYCGALADEYRTGVGPQPFFSFFDPAVRAPAVWGAGGGVDVLNQWCYANPEPMNVAGPLEEMFAMAEGQSRQQVMMMTQIICYRSQLAPTNVVVTPAPDWVTRLPDAGFPTIPPDVLQEATWSMIAKPVRGIMYHGWGCIYDTGETTGYCFTNSNSTDRIRHLLTNVVAPLGPSLLKIGRAPQEVAIMESGVTGLLGGPASFGWTAPAITFFQRARLDPKVVYEESVVEKGLSGVKVLYVPQLRYTTQRVIDKLKAFQRQGGILVGDKETLKAVTPTIVAPLVSFSAVPLSDHSEAIDAEVYREGTDTDQRSRTINAKLTMQNQAEEIRTALAAKGYSPVADSSTSEIVVYGRRWNDTPYLFAINDKRTFGTYVGQWGRIMEDGLPCSGSVSLADPSSSVGAVYELSRGGEAAFTRANGRVTVPVSFETNDGRLFAFLKERIANVALDVPSHVATGGSLDITFRVLGASGAPIDAVLPVEVRVYDSAGRELDGAGYAAAEGGVCHLVVPTNVNDAPGGYRVVATDRASGLSAEATVARKTSGAGVTKTIASGTSVVVTDADVAEYAALDRLVVEGSLTFANVGTALTLKADVSGAGPICSAAAKGLVLAGDNIGHVGSMAFTNTFVTVTSRHGLGSPTRAVIHVDNRLLFKDEGLVNDVPLRCAGSRNGNLAFTENPSDRWVQNGLMDGLRQGDCPSVTFGDYRFTGGITAKYGSFITTVAAGCVCKVVGQPLDFTPSGSSWYLFRPEAGATLVLGAAGTKSRPGKLAFYGAGMVRCACTNVFSAANAIGLGNQSGSTVLDLHGFDQELSELTNCTYPRWSSRNGAPEFLPTEGCAGHGVVSSDFPATLSLVGKACETAAVEFVEQASLTYAGTGTFNLVNRYSDTRGTLTVSSGTVRLDWGAGWGGDVAVSGSGRLVFAPGTTLGKNGRSKVAVTDGGKLNIPAGMTLTCSGLVTDAGEHGFGIYGANDLPEAIVGAGKIAVASGCPEGETFAWTGAANDGVFANGLNWQNKRAPKLKGSDVLVFSNKVEGACAVLPDGESAAYGVVFATERSLTVSGGPLRIGAAGLTAQAVNGGVSTNFVRMPLVPEQPQPVWTAEAGSAVSFGGGIVAADWGRELVLAGDGTFLMDGDNSALAAVLTLSNAAVKVRHPFGLGSTNRATNVKSTRVKFVEAGLTNATPLKLFVGQDSLEKSFVENFDDPIVFLGNVVESQAGVMNFYIGGSFTFRGGLGPVGSINFTGTKESNLFVRDRPMSFSSTAYLLMNPARLHLGVTGNVFNYLGVGGRMTCEAKDVLYSNGNGGNVYFGCYYSYGWGVIDLNGFDQDVRQIVRYNNSDHPLDVTPKTANFGTVTSERPAMLRLVKPAGLVPEYPLRLEGRVGYEQAGGATNQIVNQLSSTVGPLKVSAGALILKWGAGFTNVQEVAVANGRLIVAADSAARALGPAAGRSVAALLVGADGVVEVESGGEVTVDALQRGPHRYRPGVYGAADNPSVPASNRLPFLAGGGTVRVLSCYPPLMLFLK